MGIIIGHALTGALIGLSAQASQAAFDSTKAFANKEEVPDFSKLSPEQVKKAISEAGSVKASTSASVCFHHKQTNNNKNNTPNITTI